MVREDRLIEASDSDTTESKKAKDRVTIDGSVQHEISRMANKSSQINDEEYSILSLHI